MTLQSGLEDSKRTTLQLDVAVHMAARNCGCQRAASATALLAEAGALANFLAVRVACESLQHSPTTGHCRTGAGLSAAGRFAGPMTVAGSSWSIHVRS